MKFLPALMLLFTSQLTWAQDHWDSIQPYITDEVVAVAYLDLSQIDTLGTLEWIDGLGFGPTEGQRKRATDLMLKVQQRFDETWDYGARFVYLLFRASDLQHGGPAWVLPIKEGGDSRGMLGLLLSGRPDRFEIERDMRPPFFPDYCAVHKSAVVGGYTPEQLKQIKASQPAADRDLTEAWNALGLADCGLIVFGDEDSRRVVREMFPALPPPFAKISGELIADRLAWGGIAADLPPRTTLNLIVQADEPATAQSLQQIVRDAMELLKIVPLVQNSLDLDDLVTMTSLIDPEVFESQLTISFDNLLFDLDRLARLVTPSIKSIRQETQRNGRTAKFKQIALGMLNYESARGTYPPRATYSEDGKPLLSWRVHILPYLGLMDLYKKFRLDEPWDSEHNKQLIPLIPDVYVDPDPALARRNSQGNTSFVVPTGPDTLYSGVEAPTLKDLKDGTSNTILLVEVRPIAAPVWTRPKDWTPTKIPYEMLRRDDRDWFTTAYCDGSVGVYPLSTPVGTLRELLSPAGGGVVNRP
ncbi:MAG: DUF1559 domain-containing protein [Planctomycetota bacterium]